MGDKKEYIERGAVVWKDVYGYEGLYEVSNDGRIRNSKGQPKALSIKADKNTNYKEVSLWKDGKNKRFLVHRIVAKAFIPNPNNYKIINHKDEDGTNNCVSNLEWCDHKYNARYKKYAEKPKNGNRSRVISDEQKEKTSCSVKKYRREHAKLKFNYNGQFLSIPEISEKLNIKQSVLWMRYLRTGSIFLGDRMDGERKEQT